MDNPDEPKHKPGKILIFRVHYVHPETGEKIYPKTGKAFPIWVVSDEVR